MLVPKHNKRGILDIFLCSILMLMWLLGTLVRAFSGISVGRCYGPMLNSGWVCCMGPICKSYVVVYTACRLGGSH